MYCKKYSQIYMSKIMLVEDDQMIAEIYQKKIEAAGHEVRIASSGKEVLRLAAQESFDLILLDMVMPEMGGMEVLKELRHSGDFDADLKVIIFSNLSENEIQKEAMDNGADGFIGKTQFSPSDLVAEINRNLKEFEERKKNKARLNGEKSNLELNGKNILLIEDEEIFLEMFGKKLEDDGFHLEYAKNGAWGLKAAMEKNFDLIITDMVMPAMGGEEIVKRLRDEEKTKSIPIIVISASVTDRERDLVKSYGVSDFLVKTHIVPSDLARRIREILK